MNTTYQINEVARKRIESVRCKYQQGSLPLDDFLNAIYRIVNNRDAALKQQLLTNKQAQIKIMATAITR